MAVIVRIIVMMTATTMITMSACPAWFRRMISDDNGSTRGTKDGRHVVNVDGDFGRTITVMLFPVTIMLCA